MWPLAKVVAMESKMASLATGCWAGSYACASNVEAEFVEPAVDGPMLAREGDGCDESALRLSRAVSLASKREVTAPTRCAVSSKAVIRSRRLSATSPWLSSCTANRSRRLFVVALPV